MKTPNFMAGVVAKKVSSIAALAVKPPSIRNVTWGQIPKIDEVADFPLPQEGEGQGEGANEPFDSAPAPEVEPVVVAAAPQALSPTLSPQGEGAIRALNAVVAAWEARTNDDAIELGMLLARKILETEITTNLDAMKSLVASAIRKAGETQITSVRLHPDDAARFDGEPSIGAEIISDPTLQRGDVMVDTAKHSIDGRIATRFEALLKQLGAL